MTVWVLVAQAQKDAALAERLQADVKRLQDDTNALQNKYASGVTSAYGLSWCLCLHSSMHCLQCAYDRTEQLKGGCLHKAYKQTASKGMIGYSKEAMDACSLPRFWFTCVCTMGIGFLAVMRKGRMGCVQMQA